MNATIVNGAPQERARANLRWWLLALLAPGVVVWAWYRIGEIAAWFIGVMAAAIVVRQFFAEHGRRFYPNGLAPTIFLVVAVGLPIVSWRMWSSIQQAERALRLELITGVGGYVGNDPRVNGVSFHGPSATNERLAAISRLNDMRYLTLLRTKIDDDGLASIQDWDQLESLCILECPITDKSLEHLARLKNLKLLELRSDGITDHGLIGLKDLKGLRSLTVLSDNVTESGVAALQAELPGCRIEWRADHIAPIE